MNFVRKSWFFLGTGVIFALALLLRLPSFGSLPNGLNRDEAALAYNAFSLLKTGKDEYGEKLPITFRSFGDEKLGGYIYTVIPSIAVFGLTPAATRLPSLLSGLAIIFLIGNITWQISRSFWKPKQARVAQLFAMFFVAIAPWANHFSRVAYEAHLAMMLFLLGFSSLLQALKMEKKQRFWTALAGASFAGALLTYHSYQVLIALFLPFTLLLCFRKIRKLNRIGITIAVGFGILSLTLLWSNNFFQSNLTKHAGISPFSQERIEREFALLRLALPTPLTINKFLANRVTEPIAIFSKNYAQVLSPAFLFVTGSIQDVHNPGQLPNLHLLSLPFIIWGAHTLLKQPSKDGEKLFFLWFFLALVPSALTIDPQHTMRANALFPALEVLSALGITALLFALKPSWKALAAGTILSLFLIATLRWRAEYFVLAPQRDEEKSHEKYHLLGKKLLEESHSHDIVITQQPSSSPYIWYLFESQLDPKDMLVNIEYYPEDKEHFLHVRRIKNILFVTLIWDDLREMSKEKSISLVLRPEEIPEEMRLSGIMTYQESLFTQSGKEVYQVWHMQ